MAKVERGSTNSFANGGPHEQQALAQMEDGDDDEEEEEEEEDDDDVRIVLSMTIKSPFFKRESVGCRNYHRFGSAQPLSGLQVYMVELYYFDSATDARNRLGRTRQLSRHRERS